MRKTILSLSILCSLAFPSAALSQCEIANLIVNGDFNTTEGEAVTAPGWTGSSTPDANDENGPLNTTPGYVWSGVPIASSNGGTWQNIYGAETFEQTVQLTVGLDYTLSFEYAAQGIFYDSSFFFIGPTGATVALNGVLVFTTPLDQTQYTWEQAYYTFTASTQAVPISFGESTGNMYLGLDGVCLALATGQGFGDGSFEASYGAYPNPADGSLSVRVGNDPTSSLRFLNVLGEEVPVDIVVVGDRAVVTTSSLSNGIYFVERSDRSGRSALRIVVEHR